MNNPIQSSRDAMQETAVETRPRVLVLDPIHPDGLARLRTVADVDLIDGPALAEAELARRLPDYHAVINRSRTPIPGTAIRQAGQLRIIVRAGVGLDNIDVAAAEEAGIPVANCPDATTLAVAEHTMALLLGAARRVAAADQSMKAGAWEKGRFKGMGLAGKTLGIIGFGRIGRAVARRAQAFDMRVLVNQTRQTPELAQEWSVELVDLSVLLQQADFITLHVPMRPSNRGMIGAEELALVKPGAVLINTARGGIVDEAALLAALEDGRLAGVALDVFENEPNPDPQLVQNPRVTATPHIAASTEDAQRQVALDAATKVLDALQRTQVADTLSLRVVPVERVFPHEGIHPRRVERLSRRLSEDATLRNPPVVAEMGNSYVVLDGATRVTAMRQLGLPHIIVQVVDMGRDNVQLHSWYHAVHDCPVPALLDVARAVRGLALEPCSVDKLAHALWEQNALGYLQTADDQGFLLHPDGSDGEQDWVEILNELVDGYGACADVERTLTADVNTLRTQFNDLAGLFVYPQFAPEIVVQNAAKGRLLPAGLTRFIIPGRILRLNVPLEILGNRRSFAEKCAWLDHVVEEKLSTHGLRYYAEPVVLLDE